MLAINKAFFSVKRPDIVTKGSRSMHYVAISDVSCFPLTQQRNHGKAI